MEFPDFISQNAWWKGRAHLGEDRHIRDYLEKKYRWEPPLLGELKPEAGNIYSLRGPRQVGKTTLLKLMAKSLIEKGADGRSVFYASCDAVSGSNELLKVLRGYLEFASANRLGRTFILLDEVSSVEEWQKAVKVLADSGELKDSAVVLTGSHTLDIKHGFERLPGRTGRAGKEHLLLPLNFREYVRLVNPEAGEKLGAIKEPTVEEFNRAARGMQHLEKQLRLLFNQYLLSGGFPLAINEFHTENRIPEYVYETYARWVIGDITRWGKQEKILKQLLRAAILKQGTAISWDSLAKEAEIKSHKTVSAYVEDLENMFAILVLYFLEPNKKIADPNKNKKIHFFDPMIFHTFNRMLYFKEAEISPQLVEAACAAHFARLCGGQAASAGQKINDFVFYWKNKRETDILARTKGGLLAVEVKYQDRIPKEAFESLYHFKGGIIASKSTLQTGEKYSIIPVHLLLAAMP